LDCTKARHTTSSHLVDRLVDFGTMGHDIVVGAHHLGHLHSPVEDVDSPVEYVDRAGDHSVAGYSRGELRTAGHSPVEGDAADTFAGSSRSHEGVHHIGAHNHRLHQVQHEHKA
jgi:hypothetical protein